MHANVMLSGIWKVGGLLLLKLLLFSCASQLFSVKLQQVTLQNSWYMFVCESSDLIGNTLDKIFPW